MRTLIMALAATMMSASAYAAQGGSGDAAAGKKVAQQVCAQCHDVSGNERQQNPPGNAPAFIAVVESPSGTREKIISTVKLPHGRMNIVLLSGRDVEDVVSYILSLRK